MPPLKIRKVGNSLAVLLNSEILMLLGGLKENDQVFITKTPTGIELSPYDPDFAAKMAAARDVMREDRDVLRELAK